MEDFINTLMSSGPAGIVSAAVVYLVIWLQRNKTSKKRDEDNILLNYRVDQLEKGQNSLSESISELQDSIINLTISINKLMEKKK
jgi:uncharacterized protein YlxW (UPF0749 family)